MTDAPLTARRSDVKTRASSSARPPRPRKRKTEATSEAASSGPEARSATGPQTASASTADTRPGMPRDEAIPSHSSWPSPEADSQEDTARTRDVMTPGRAS